MHTRVSFENTVSILKGVLYWWLKVLQLRVRMCLHGEIHWHNYIMIGRSLGLCTWTLRVTLLEKIYNADEPGKFDPNLECRLFVQLLTKHFSGYLIHYTASEEMFHAVDFLKCFIQNDLKKKNSGKRILSLF